MQSTIPVSSVEKCQCCDNRLLMLHGDILTAPAPSEMLHVADLTINDLYTLRVQIDSELKRAESNS